jgi:hypothetical protein
MPRYHKAPSTSESMDEFLEVHMSSLITFEMVAEQSWVSLDLQRTQEERQNCIRERQQHIQDLSAPHVYFWQEHHLLDVEAQEIEAVPQLDITIITSIYNFARLQYSVSNAICMQACVRTNAARMTPSP